MAIQELDVLTKDGLRTYTETLVAWIKSKLDVKNNDNLSIKLTSEGNQVVISLMAGNSTISHLTLPIVDGETSGLMTPTMLARLGTNDGESISFQDLIDGTDIGIGAMEYGYIYIKDGKIYMPAQNPNGNEYNVIEFSNTGIRSINNGESFDLYATKDDLDNVTIAVDEELNDVSENPVQNKILNQLFTDMDERIDDVYESIPDLTNLTTQVTNNSTTISSLNSLLYDIKNVDTPRLEDKIDQNRSDLDDLIERFYNTIDSTELEVELQNIRGQVITIDGIHYTFNNNNLVRYDLDGLITSTEYETGTYLLEIRGKYYIYNIDEQKLIELVDTEQLTDTKGKLITVNYIGRVNQSDISSATTGNYIYDTTYNKLYQKQDDDVIEVGIDGDTYILSYDNPETEVIEYYLCTIGEKIRKIYTQDDGVLATKEELIKGISNIIPVKYFRTELTEPDTSDGEYYFNTESYELKIKDNSQWKKVAEIGKYLVVNADVTSDTRGEYYIVDLDKSYTRIVLNGIEKLRVRVSENTYDTLIPQVDSNGQYYVTVDLTGISQQESTDVSTAGKLIDPEYWQVSTLPEGDPGQYALDDNNVLYRFDNDWEQLPEGSYLVKHLAPHGLGIEDVNILYLLVVKEVVDTQTFPNTTMLQGTLTQIANFSDLGGGADGAVTDVKMDGTSYKNSLTGVVSLPKLTTPGDVIEMLGNYYDKVSVNNTFATKSYVQMLLWNNLIKFTPVRLSNISVISTRYSFNTRDSGHSLIVNLNESSQRLLLQVTNSSNNVTSYYSSWGEIPNAILPSENYTYNDLYYSIDSDGYVMFWTYKTSTNKFIPTDIKTTLSELSNEVNLIKTSLGENGTVTQEINTNKENIDNLKRSKKVVYPYGIYTTVSDANNRCDVDEYYILSQSGEIDNNATLKFLTTVDDTDVSENVNEVCLVILEDGTLYLYNYDTTPKFIEIVTSGNSPQTQDTGINNKVILCKYWRDTDVTLAQESEYWYNPTNNILKYRTSEGWEEVNNLLNNTNLYIDLTLNKVYRYNNNSMYEIVLSDGESQQDETTTDAQLNLILKEVADTLDYQSKKINDLKLDLSKASENNINNNLNIVKGFDLGYDATEYTVFPSVAKYGDIILYSTNQNNVTIKELRKCIYPTQYPVVVIRCLASNESITESFNLPIIKYNGDQYETVNVTVQGNSNEKIIAENLCLQLEQNGYVRLNWSNQRIESNEELSQYSGSVAVYYNSEKDRYYVKIVPKNFGDLVTDSSKLGGTDNLNNRYIKTINNTDSSILTYNKTKNDNDSPASSRGPLVAGKGSFNNTNLNVGWPKLEVENKLTGTNPPTQGVITGQCYFYVSGNTHKPYWAHVTSSGVNWYDANGNLFVKNLNT